jgi:hypothetical protein
MMKIPFAFLLVLIFFSCRQSERIPDVSQIIVDPSIVRFEEKLFEADTQEIEATLQGLINMYPEFSEVFLHQIIADPSYGNNMTASASVFVRDSFIRELYQTCRRQYSDFSRPEKELKQALRFFKYYFPDKPVPDIYTCVTGFEVGSFTIGEKILGIGLDFYLGAEYPYYPPDLFPVYIRQTMSSDYLVAKSVQALVANYVGEINGTRLLDFMIRNGIELYIKQKLLPETPEEIIHEYTSEQMEWLKANESQIWAYLLQEDLLYSIDYRSYQKMITPSPNVPKMHPEAPGRVANWIGMRIIERYIERNQALSLTDLLMETDPQKILTESRYKPRQ